MNNDGQVAGCTSCRLYFKTEMIQVPKLSDILFDLLRSLARKDFAKILDISTDMPVVCANLSA